MEHENIFKDLTVHEIECDLQHILQFAFQQKYGNTPDGQIVLRFQEEWAAMECSNTILDVAALYELVVWLKKNEHPYLMRGCAGSSFILYLLGITTGNPLPPHYHCPVCRSVQWVSGYRDGFDLPREKYCEEDHAKMNPDGHDIPWQILWGYDDHGPVFELDVPTDLTNDIMALLDNHWLKKLKSNCNSKETYLVDNSVALGQLRINCRLDTLTIHRGFHQKIIDCYCSAIALDAWQTLFDFYDGYDESSILGIDTFADLLSFYGLHNAIGAWDEETVFLNREFKYAPSELIAFRDDVFQYLISHKFLPKDAWKGMNRVRKGLSLPVVTEEMKHSYDKWILQRCEKIGYLFPKSHAIEYIFFRLKATILPDTIQFIRTGLNGIDYALGGINCSDVIVVGGRPAIGKIGFALDIASYLVCTAGKKVTIYTPNDNLETINRGIAKRGCAEKDSNISIFTDSTLHISMIKEKLNSEHIDFVIIDDLQSFGKSKKKIKAQITSIMRQIKGIAKEYRVPVLLLTNLSRKIELRNGHIPLLKDVPCYESVTPYTDSILLLYREAYYDMDADRKNAWCFVVQNRRGGLAEIPLEWNDSKQGFES